MNSAACFQKMIDLLHFCMRWWASGFTAALILSREAWFMLALFLAVIGIVVVISVLRPQPIETLMTRAAGPFFAITYIALPLTLMRDLHTDTYGGYLILLIMLTAWLGDTFAYFSGRWFGKTKLHPILSPKKTVAGAVGGLGEQHIRGCGDRTFFHHSHSHLAGGCSRTMLRCVRPNRRPLCIRAQAIGRYQRFRLFVTRSRRFTRSNRCALAHRHYHLHVLELRVSEPDHINKTDERPRIATEHTSTYM